MKAVKKKEKEVNQLKFRDLFLPKIARSDPKVRKEAVNEVENAEVLKKVIENDSDPEVRALAQKRLEQMTA